MYVCVYIYIYISTHEYVHLCLLAYASCHLALLFSAARSLVERLEAIPGDLANGQDALRLQARPYTYVYIYIYDIYIYIYICICMCIYVTTCKAM